MNKNLVLALLLITSGVSSGSEIRFLENKVSTVSCCPAGTVGLYLGPIQNVKDSKNPNRLAWYYRVGVVVSEVYTSLIIEEIGIGEENVHSIISSRIVSLDKHNVDQVTWLSPMSFRIRMDGVDYKITNINEPRVKLVELPRS